MQTKEAVKTKTIKQKIQLVKGEFTTSEAYDVINALIDEKINFHKLQRLQQSEGNHRGETNELDGRIKELQEERRIAKEFIADTRAKGLHLNINGILEITVAE